MSGKKDTPEEKQAAHEWLAEVVEALDLPEDLPRSTIKEILNLTAMVVYQRSRPAGPETAFLLGVAVGAETAHIDDADERRDAMNIAFAKKVDEIVNRLD